MLFVEKYRPQEFSDVVGLMEEIPSAISQGNMMHMLLIGSPGTGKTTTAKVIIKQLNADSLELNASNENGIDVIRTKVNDFAMTQSMTGNQRIVFLDEADGLSKDAQKSLRALMEDFHKNCRFILTANYENKIIDALKSRCDVFKFQLPKKVDIVSRLSFIIAQESIVLGETGILEAIVDKYYPDIRKCIGTIQSLSFLGRPVLITDIKKEELLAKQLIEVIQKEKFSGIRQFVLDANVDYGGMLMELFNYVFNNKDVFGGAKSIQLYERIKICNRNLGSVIWQEIEFLMMLLGMMQDLK